MGNYLLDRRYRMVAVCYKAFESQTVKCKFFKFYNRNFYINKVRSFLYIVYTLGCYVVQYSTSLTVLK